MESLASRPVAPDPSSSAESVRLRLRVAPGAREAAIVGRHGDAWKLRVCAAPERGRANADVLALLSATLGVSPGRVRLVTGHASRDKVVEVDGMSLAEAETLLVAAGADRR